jgi:putative intracellular protease/amidase
MYIETKPVWADGRAIALLVPPELDSSSQPQESLMNAKGTILIVASSIDTFELKTGQTVPVGYYLNELAIPALAAIDAGYEIVLATPKGNRPAVDQQSLATSHFGNSEAKLREAIDFAASTSSIQNPRSIRSVIGDGLDNYVGVFVPGGHPPMVDLMQDPDLGEVLRHFHAHSKPTALLCHGPIAATATMLKAKSFRQALVDNDKDAAKEAAEGWQYAGYRMTIFSNDEERYAEEVLLEGAKVPFYPATALEVAGAKVETREFFKPHVVQDR